MLVVAEVNRGWVLDGICRDMLPYLPDAAIAYVETRQRRRWRLPRARTYFFSHYSLLLTARRTSALPRGARTFVLYTHPRETGRSPRRLVKALSGCTQVLSMASMHTRQLAAWGVPADRMTTVLGAADPSLFPAHPRSHRGTVGIVSAYYPRKSPEHLFEVIRRLGDTPVLLVGRGWEQHPDFEAIASAGNVRHYDVPYSAYPELYAQMDVFLSLSVLEGGPIPLIEAMMSNVVPVATRTGFAPDIVRHGENGFLCDVSAPTEQVLELIAAAAEVQRDVRQDVVHLDWRRYASFLV